VVAPDEAASGAGAGDACAEACARRWLLRILGAIGVDARVERRRRGGRVVLDARCGAGGSQAIGPRGQTLEAIRLIVARILERQCPGEEGLVSVDVEGYAARRRGNLVRKAIRAAEAVCESGEPAVLEALTPAERFLVHDTLRDLPRVTSASVGEGRVRDVRIFPADS